VTKMCGKPNLGTFFKKAYKILSRSSLT